MRNLLLASATMAALSAPLPAHAQLSGFTDAIRALFDRTTEGFAQLTNYMKGQVGAQQQIADASNTAMAGFHRNMRNAQIRDEHTISPAACESMDNGQAITVAAGQSWVVSASLSSVLSRRREGGPGTPSWHGSGQAAADRAQLHQRRYCSELEAQEGICQMTERPNWDVRASSMSGVLSYGPVPENMNAAVDFSVTALQPIPLPAVRGDALRSMQGQDTKLWRDRYAANMSLAADVHTRSMARRAQSVTLTPAQRAQQQAQGLVVTQQGSWLQAASLEVNRRMGGVAWKAELERMTPTAVLREIASILALNSHLQLETLLVVEDVANTNAALLAAKIEGETGRPQDAYRRLDLVPTPQVR